MKRLASVVGIALGMALAIAPRPTRAESAMSNAVGSFLRALYTEHESALRKRFERDWSTAVGRGVADTPANQRRFLQTMFVYQLVRHGGILGNHFLIREDDGRHPDTMLRDAFAERPRFQLTYIRGWEGSAARVARGDVFTFGRCDEFEMEEAALLRRLFQIPARIAMVTSDHVVTEVKLDGGYLRLDSSFLRCLDLAAEPITDAPPEDGVYRVSHTNDLADRDFHPERRVTLEGVRRVAAATATFLLTEPTSPYCKRR